MNGSDPAESPSADVFEKWPFLRGRAPIDWAAFVQVLKDRGRLEAAMQLARQALQHPACNEKTRRRISGIFAQTVPEWHWNLVRDTRRNDAYDAALRRAVGPQSLVLDIGAGSGLLGMMAARAGAGAVVSCEMNPVTASLAEDIVRRNGFSDRVRVVNRHSEALVAGPGGDLDRRADIMVSEIFGSDLLGEQVLPVHADTVSRLLRKGGQVIPALGDIMVALGWFPGADHYRLGTHAGFDLSPFNVVSPPLVALRNTQEGLRVLSEPKPLFSFDFGRPESWPELRASVDVIAEGGQANAILQWIRLVMDDSGAPDSVYEAKPDPDILSCWAVMATPLATPRALRAGECLRIAGLRSECSLMVWLDAEGQG